MTDLFARRGIFAASLGAVLLLATACESSRIPMGTQAPSAPPPQAQTAPAPMPAPVLSAPVVPSVPAWANPPSRTEVQARRAPDAMPTPPPLTQSLATATPPRTPEIRPQRTESSVSRIALLLPLSGRNAPIGKALRNAAQLALFDFADQQFELLFHDTKGTQDGAREAAQAAVLDGAALILGPLLSANARAVAPVARPAQVPVISFSSDISAAGDGVFVMGFLPGTEVRRVVSYAARKGVRRFAVLAPQNAYGDLVVRVFSDSVPASGGQVTRVARYDPSATDFSPVVRNLANYDTRHRELIALRKQLETRGDEVSKKTLQRLEHLQTVGDPDFEALLVADGGKRLQAIAALLPYFDVDPKVVRIMGTGQWDAPGTGTEPALLGGWFAAPDPEGRADLMRRYEETFGERPPRLASLAYDATALAAVLVRGKEGPDYSAVHLTQPSGFLGRDGAFRFNADGAIERNLAILQVQERDFRVVEPAPETFDKPMY